MVLIKKTITIKTTEKSDRFNDDELDGLVDDLSDWLEEKLCIMALQAASDQRFEDIIKIEVG